MSTISKTYFPLKQLTRISFGVHLTPVDVGRVLYLQARQFDDYGRFGEDPLLFAPDGSLNAHMLWDGDVLFPGKGNRYFGWCYRDRVGPAVASSMFFVIRPDQKIIQPDYLTAILNLPQNQAHFKLLASGTNIASIRKSELEAFMIPVIPISEQEKVVELYKYHLRETVLMERMASEKRNLYKATISKIINSTHAKKINAKRDQ